MVPVAERDLIERKDWAVLGKVAQGKVAQGKVAQGKLVVLDKIAQGKVVRGKVVPDTVVVVSLFLPEICQADLQVLQYQPLRQWRRRDQKSVIQLPLCRVQP